MASRAAKAPELRLAVRPGLHRHHGELVGIRIVADFRHLHRADGEILQLGLRRVDDLVRGLRAAGRMRDDVALFDWERLRADPHLALAFEHDEHLLVDAMIVERPGALAGRHHGQIAAELLRAEPPADVADLRGKFLRRFLRAGKVGAVANLAEFDVGDVQDRLRHEALLKYASGSAQTTPARAPARGGHRAGLYRA